MCTMIRKVHKGAKYTMRAPGGVSLWWPRFDEYVLRPERFKSHGTVDQTC